MFHAASYTACPATTRSESSGTQEPEARRSEARRSEARPSGQRDVFFDNAKYLAIVLVAVAHSWEPLKDDSRSLQAAYMFVYAFHMPAFIVVSGFFSRSFDMRPDRLRRLVTGVAVPYVLFETAYTLFDRYAGGASDHEISLLDPWFLTWFLIALFIWRLTTPLWKAIRWPLPAALLIAMLATTSSSIGDDLDLQRVLQFLPFFVLGLCLRKEDFDRVRDRRVRVASVPVAVVAAAFCWWAVPRMNASWLYHRDSAPELGVPWWVGPPMMFGLFVCSLVLTVCFLAWVPRRRMWFTTLGAGTLYGYLLHGLVIKAADYQGWFDHRSLHTPLGAIAVSVVFGATVTVLCTKPVRRILKFAVEPEMRWAFQPSTRTARGSTPASSAPVSASDQARAADAAGAAQGAAGAVKQETEREKARA